MLKPEHISCEDWIYLEPDAKLFGVALNGQLVGVAPSFECAKELADRIALQELRNKVNISVEVRELSCELGPKLYSPLKEEEDVS